MLNKFSRMDAFSSACLDCLCRGGGGACRCTIMMMANPSKLRHYKSELTSVPDRFFSLIEHARSKGTYSTGDSAHALQITQNMGNRTTNVKL